MIVISNAGCPCMFDDSWSDGWMLWCLPFRSLLYFNIMASCVCDENDGSYRICVPSPAVLVQYYNFLLLRPTSGLFPQCVAWFVFYLCAFVLLLDQNFLKPPSRACKTLERVILRTTVFYITSLLQRSRVSRYLAHPNPKVEADLTCFRSNWPPLFSSSRVDGEDS